MGATDGYREELLKRRSLREIGRASEAVLELLRYRHEAAGTSGSA